MNILARLQSDVNPKSYKGGFNPKITHCSYSCRSVSDRGKKSAKYLKNYILSVMRPHCPTVLSTRPVRYSGYYDWFILLWPRHDHFSSWIKIKGVPFWKSNQFVVTQPNLQIIYDGQIFIFWQRSKVLSIKLWPKLKFWHWSPWCRVPVSISIAQILVTYQIYGLFEGATL